jgi:hypothetical protein
MSLSSKTLVPIAYQWPLVSKLFSLPVTRK